MKKLVQEFKEFALGGSLVETGVGLVMALALAALITSLVEKILMPIVAAVFGQPDFSSLWRLKLRGSEAAGTATYIEFGSFVTAFITFLSVAFAVYFFIVKPWQAYKARIAAEEEETPEEPSEDIKLLTEIRDALAK